jgi:translation elongation factor EF-Tu-like GTPase
MENGDDFIAVLKFRNTTAGGRKTPAFSGYRPQIKFHFTEMQTSGRQTFVDRESVLPGETITAYIKIASPKIYEKLLSEGMEFEFREGAITVGTGTIITILNPVLNKNT